MASDPQQLTGTLSNYIVRVRRWLNETDSTKSRWQNTFLKQLFNTAYRRRCAQIELAHEGHFTLVATRDLEEDKERYEWPPTLERVLKMELVRSDGRRVPIQRYERHYEALETQGSSNDGYLPTWRPISGGFVLEPKPQTTVTGGIRLEYHGIPAELSADGDVLHDDFPLKFDELLVMDTAIMAFHAEGLQENGVNRSLMVERSAWEFEFERYIDSRIVGNQQVVPFVPFYRDS